MHKELPTTVSPRHRCLSGAIRSQQQAGKTPGEIPAQFLPQLRFIWRKHVLWQYPCTEQAHSIVRLRPSETRPKQGRRTCKPPGQCSACAPLLPQAGRDLSAGVGWNVSLRRKLSTAEKKDPGFLIFFVRFCLWKVKKQRHLGLPGKTVRQCKCARVITTNHAFSTNPSPLHLLTPNAELFSLRVPVLDTGQRQFFNKNISTEKVFIVVLFCFFFKVRI